MTLKNSKKRFKNRIFHWPDIQEFREEEATKHIFYETPNTVGAVWCMHPGQDLPIHSHEKADDIWIVVEGTADFIQSVVKWFKLKLEMLLLHVLVKSTE